MAYHKKNARKNANKSRNLLPNNQIPNDANLRYYRIEGIDRKGVRYVKVVGRSGNWHICGIDGQKANIVRPDCKTIEDVLRIGKRIIWFHPICVREITQHQFQ